MEALLDPSTSDFALIGDEYAMSRLAVYREFLSSEYNYIQDLLIIQELYEEPFWKELSKKKNMIEEKEIQIIFGNYKEILDVVYFNLGYS